MYPHHTAHLQTSRTSRTSRTSSPWVELCWQSDLRWMNSHHFEFIRTKDKLVIVSCRLSSVQREISAGRQVLVINRCVISWRSRWLNCSVSSHFWELSYKSHVWWRLSLLKIIFLLQFVVKLLKNKIVESVKYCRRSCEPASSQTFLTSLSVTGRRPCWHRWRVLSEKTIFHFIFTTLVTLTTSYMMF